MAEAGKNAYDESGFTKWFTGSGGTKTGADNDRVGWKVGKSTASDV
jgi:hypothetical protein